MAANATMAAGLKGNSAMGHKPFKDALPTSNASHGAIKKSRQNYATTQSPAGRQDLGNTQSPGGLSSTQHTRVSLLNSSFKMVAHHPAPTTSCLSTMQPLSKLKQKLRNKNYL